MRVPILGHVGENEQAGKNRPVTEFADPAILEEVNDELDPPILLCCLIGLTALILGGAVLWLHTDVSEQRLTAAVTSMPKDLSGVIRLKQIYSSPPEPEDPSKYPKLPDSEAKAPSARGPAKIAQ
jgi:hypothetical protein